ncbi:hypothetical protein GEMRC1_012377 [Eukaryota sp. GEM-RC1]
MKLSDAAALLTGTQFFQNSALVTDDLPLTISVPLQKLKKRCEITRAKALTTLCQEIPSLEPSLLSTFCLALQNVLPHLVHDPNSRVRLNTARLLQQVSRFPKQHLKPALPLFIAPWVGLSFDPSSEVARISSSSFSSLFKHPDRLLSSFFSHFQSFLNTCLSKSSVALLNDGWSQEQSFEIVAISLNMGVGLFNWVIRVSEEECLNSNSWQLLDLIEKLIDPGSQSGLLKLIGHAMPQYLRLSVFKLIMSQEFWNFLLRQDLTVDKFIKKLISKLLNLLARDSLFTEVLACLLVLPGGLTSEVFTKILEFIKNDAFDDTACELIPLFLKNSGIIQIIRNKFSMEFFCGLNIF